MAERRMPGEYTEWNKEEEEEEETKEEEGPQEEEIEDANRYDDNITSIVLIRKTRLTQLQERAGQVLIVQSK